MQSLESSQEKCRTALRFNQIILEKVRDLQFTIINVIVTGKI